MATVDLNMCRGRWRGEKKKKKSIPLLVYLYIHICVYKYMCICVLFRMHWVPSGVAAADFGTSQVACRQTSAPSHTRGERGRAPSSTRRHDPTVAIIKASWSLPRERTCPTIHRRYINIYDAPLFKIAQKERAPTRSSSLLWFFCFLFFFYNTLFSNSFDVR